MRIRPAAKFLAGTLLLVHCIYSGYVAAYDPNHDANAARRNVDRSPVKREVFPLVAEFERLQPASGIWRREGQGYPAQLDVYARGDSPAVPTPPYSTPVGSGDPLLWHGQHYWYGQPVWIPPGAQSPRIPWWSLRRATRH